jgi:acetyl-CoA C-acetyltransferase
MVTLLYAMKNSLKSVGLATTLCGGGVSMACAMEMIYHQL